MSMAEKTPQTSAPRPPVIVIMGHIDHGKSTLLDYVRKTNVTDREAGGITQHVSAYEVEHESPDGRRSRITFLDTPGHAAFSSIRERGVRIADIAVLIVSAEDGVKPQTVEALEVIKAAAVPYVVAITKIDKPAANVERTKMSLAESGIYIEGYGGGVPWVAISSKTGEGVPELLDMMLLVADLEELTGDPGRPAEGFVLESNLDSKKGLTATLIVKNGTLKRGQFVTAGQAIAPVRIMENFLGKPVSEATFSSPIRIIGWDKLPAVGETFSSFDDKKTAIESAALGGEAAKKAAASTTEAEEGPDKKVIPVTVKADTMGSLEAIEKELGKLVTDKIELKLVNKGLGTISENDVKNALGNADSVIVGFNTKPDSMAKSFALRNGVDIREFNIIYKLTEWFEELIKERTPKMLTEEIVGEAKVLKVFSKNKDKQVVGGRVESGTLKVGGSVKVVRRGEDLGEGRVRELQQSKNKTSEVREGTEFGALIEFQFDIAPGDHVKAFEMIEK